MNHEFFLADLENLRPLHTLADADGLTPLRLAIGPGNGGLEVAVARAAHKPSQDILRSAWKSRQNGRPTPVLLAVIYGDRAALCGPTGETPPLFLDLDIGQVERICRTALAEPNKHAAIRFLWSILPEIKESLIPGLRNQGLFATHELEKGVPRRSDWSQAQKQAKNLLDKRGRELLEGLGYQIAATNQPYSVLRSGPKKIAVAIFLDRSEACDLVSDRFGGMTPIQYALAKADEENLDYVLVDHGSSLRIHTTSGKGVGRRGRTDTYIELHLDLLPTDRAAYLWLLFSGAALADKGTFTAILEASQDYASDLGTRLRDRIYEFVIPDLAIALAKARKLKKPTAQDLKTTYEMALLVLFRLLFIAYAEDKDLLPYHTNQRYRDRSLKKKARELANLWSAGVSPAISGSACVPPAQSGQDARAPVFDDSTSHWDEVVRLFRVVNTGKPKEWGVPAYNGGMFSEEQDISPAGSALAEIRLNNKEFGPVLCKLLVDPTPEGFGPVDFRSLGVRDFGTIYEGLLESELSVAEEDLIVDEAKLFVPLAGARASRPQKGEGARASRPQEHEGARASRPQVHEGAQASCPQVHEGGGRDARAPDVRQGQIYLHNSSGARKATGSYYTKDFAVEHLLDHALEPAIADHLARLDKQDERRAAESFFDFRVADIAMGSGHFLVAAVDRIERRFSGYLARRPLPGVIGELSRLRQAALEGIEKAGGSIEGIEIENTQLLRRQIVRRCIYGVDINNIAVQLARLSLWIHTFVPGLPLSFLDHNIVCGNSLVGIATFEEVADIIERGQLPLLDRSPDALIGDAEAAVRRLAQLSDADASEIRDARKAFAEQKKAVAATARMFDIYTASRLPESGVDPGAEDFEPNNRLIVEGYHRRAIEALGELTPFHFPIAFPEVFLRDRSGFDVILGNPPWEEATLEEDDFWSRYLPGFQALPQHDQEAVKKRYRKNRPDLVELFNHEGAVAESLRNALTNGPFPGMGTGDPDVYKAFCWRFWSLTCQDNGRIGVVLPRSALCAKGSSEFREKVFDKAKADISFLVNNGQWVFPEVHPQYTIGLVCLTRESCHRHSISLRGPFASLERFMTGTKLPPVIFAANEAMGWTDTAALPLLPAEESAIVFAQLRKSPRLDMDDGESWRARPHTELHATNEKGLMKLVEKQPDGYWPVFKGESFDIWEPDRGIYYAWADPEKMIKHLQKKRLRSVNNSRSPFFDFKHNSAWCDNPDTLPCHFPRIAFRDITNRTNQRTVVIALTPPNCFIANQAPFLLWIRGDEQDQAFLLGVLSSIPLDWYARRFVETHVNYHVFNPFPIPRPTRDNPLWQRTVSLAGRLASPDKRFAKWAEAVGVECGKLDAAEKDGMIYELDAVVAHLYGLSESQLVHIFETFHEGWDYGDRLKAVLEHYRAWGKK